MRRILFFLAFSLATTIYVCQQLHLPIPIWINNYVNDFLFLPIVLGFCLFVVRRIKRNPNLQLSLPLILGVSLFYCIYFEWYLPLYNPRYTGDWIDCLLYFCGGIIFYFLHRVNK